MSTRVAVALVGVAVVGWLAPTALAAHAAEPPAASAQTQAAEHGQGEVDLNPLDFKGDLAIWTAAVFLVLLVILWAFAWRPIANGLQKREQRIADEIASAERSNAEGRQLLQQYEERLAASGEEVRQMLDAARRDAEHVGHQVVERAKADAEAEHQRALKEIEQAVANALQELAEESATLAVDLAGRIVHSQLDPKAHSHLIEQAVTDFSKPRSGKDGPIGN
ncbi:MAG TPA: F0F1 ATP synthase subunit B [Thermoguttaceae bacterium]|nr:F0F1 ATP synthase subunit B [Thermoguttaceae bacterium]